MDKIFHSPCILDNVSKFKSIFQAIAYYQNNNPARERRVNLLELDRKGNSYGMQFDGEHPADVWSSVVHSFQSVFSCYTHDQRSAYLWLRFCPEELDRPTRKEIGKKLSRNPNTIGRWIRQIDDDLSDELKRRNLLEL